MYSIKDKTIDFFWDTDRIFDIVSYETGIQSNNMVMKKNEVEDGSKMDFIITEDKKEYVVETLRPVFIHLFDYFIDIAPSDTNVLYVNEPSVEFGIYLNGFSVICIRDREDKVVVNEQRLNIISSLCQEYITVEIIKKWSEDNALNDIVKAASENSKIIVEKLKKNILYLKKRAYMRSFV